MWGRAVVSPNHNKDNTDKRTTGYLSTTIRAKNAV